MHSFRVWKEPDRALCHDEQTLQKIVWCSSGTAQRAIMFGRWNARHRFWYGHRVTGYSGRTEGKER
jgi:hypothetical protein